MGLKVLNSIFEDYNPPTIQNNDELWKKNAYTVTKQQRTDAEVVICGYSENMRRTSLRKSLRL